MVNLGSSPSAIEQQQYYAVAAGADHLQAYKPMANPANLYGFYQQYQNSHPALWASRQRCDEVASMQPSV